MACFHAGRDLKVLLGCINGHEVVCAVIRPKRWLAGHSCHRRAWFEPGSGLAPFCPILSGWRSGQGNVADVVTPSLRSTWDVAALAGSCPVGSQPTLACDEPAATDRLQAVADSALRLGHRGFRTSPASMELA